MRISKDLSKAGVSKLDRVASIKHPNVLLATPQAETLINEIKNLVGTSKTYFLVTDDIDDHIKYVDEYLILKQNICNNTISGKFDLIVGVPPDTDDDTIDASIKHMRSYMSMLKEGGEMLVITNPSLLKKNTSSRRLFMGWLETQEVYKVLKCERLEGVFDARILIYVVKKKNT